MGEVLLLSLLVPLWLKLAWTVMVLVIVVVYWHHHRPANFLWFSDLAILMLVPGLWLESSFIVSLAACMVLVPELLWGVSFFGRLLSLPQVTGLADYMWDERIPRWLRAMSLFHVPLLVMLFWAPWRLGYDPGVYLWAVLIAWFVLLLTRWLTKPEKNINHVFRLPVAGGVKLTSAQLIVVMMTAVPLLLLLPGHLLLWVLFGN